MRVSYRTSQEEQRKLQKLSEQRMIAKHTPNWLAKGYWWGLLPLAIVGLGFGYGRFDIVVVCFVIFMVLANGANYIWQQVYEGRVEAEYPDQKEWGVLIEDEGLSLISEQSRHWYAWAMFEAVEKTQNYIFVHCLGGGFVFVPRRAFASEEECNMFITRLRARIPKPSG